MEEAPDDPAYITAVLNDIADGGENQQGARPAGVAEACGQSAECCGWSFARESAKLANVFAVSAEELMGIAKPVRG